MKGKECILHSFSFSPLKDAIMHENRYQSLLIGKLKVLLPGCFIIINDPQQTQGIPDLLILFGNKWAMLETKISSNAKLRPNQDYYVNFFNKLSFAAFINPANEEDVLFGLHQEMNRP